MSSDNRPWHYLANDIQMGPVAERVLRHMIREGSLLDSVLVWTPGMTEWQPAVACLPAYARLDYEADPAVAPVLPDAIPAVLPLHDVSYFPVSPLKFIVMSIATLGLYDMYWSYRNWHYIKSRDGVRIRPFWRAWFTLFFHYDLMHRIKSDLGDTVPVSYHAGWLTVAYLALGFAGRLPDPFWLVSFLSFVPVLPAVRAIRSANQISFGAERLNQRFTAWNLAAITAFILFSAFVLVPESWL